MFSLYATRSKQIRQEHARIHCAVTTRRRHRRRPRLAIPRKSADVDKTESVLLLLTFFFFRVYFLGFHSQHHVYKTNTRMRG